MIKTLIADDDIIYIKYVINNILNEFEDIIISNITTDGEETLKLISSGEIDLVLLDLLMPKKNGLEILNDIEKLQCFKRPKVVIISGDVSSINAIQKSVFICEIINKNTDIKVIKNKFNNIINNIKFDSCFEDIKSKIIIDLSNIGYNFKYKGTNYLLDSIIYVLKSNNLDLLDNLEQNVYKYIAYINRKSVNNIKTNIIKATNLANISQHQSIINDYFSFEVKLTPKLVISTVIRKLQYCFFLNN